MTARALYPLITRDAVLDGMVAALANATSVSTNVGRYMGELSSEEAFKRGVAGRCPAVRMAFVSDRTLRGTIGRRIDYVEAKFVAVVFSDSSKSKDDRSVLLDLSEKVANLIAARRFGLEIKPMKSTGVAEFPGIEHCTAYGASFFTRYRVDHSINAPTVPMSEAVGDLFLPAEEIGDDADDKQLVEVEVSPLDEEATA